MSPGPDTMILSALERHNLPALFAALPLLRDLDSEVLAEITREVEWFSVPGGATLFEAGQPADGLYVVVNGTLGLFAPQAGGGSRPSGRVAAGETVGEAEVISGTNRTVTVVALRNCEVARLPVATFEKLVVRNPGSLRQIANVVIKRLDSLQHAGTQARATPKTFVVVPSGEDVDAAKFAAGLAGCLKALGRTELVLSTQGHEQTSHWFHRLERSNDFVVYIADSLQTNWTRLCLRQADCVLLLARSDGEPRAWHGLEAHLDAGSAGRSIELVLIGRPQSLATARRWLDLHQVRRHHHVRNADDLALVSGGRGCRRLRVAFGALHIEDLPLPFFCTSASLTSGQAAVHRRGTLWLWLRAAVSIPGVLPPVFTERQVHVDGATINNLPVDIMRESMEGAIVAVDAGADRMLDTSTEMSEVPPAWRPWSWLRRVRPRVNIVQILLRCGMINSA